MKKYITKQSSIKGAGKGLFTNTSFKKGELIGLAHVNGQPTKEVGSNHNHNEKNPTAYSKKINNKRFIYASKNLKPREEITTNYRMQPELEQPEDFMREGGSLLTKKVTCKSCGWKWDAEDGGKDITTCHKCGGQGLIHAQKGGNKDAMTGMMKARLAYANEFGNPAAERMINLPDNPYQFDNGDTGSHYMASMDNYAVPQIQDENGVLQLGDYGPESNEAIRFDSDEDANYFAENYKDVSPGFIEADLNEDEIEEYRRGGYIVEEIDTFQNGGVYTVKGSDGVYKKVNGKWQVDWNRSGKYQPLSKGDVKARTAVLDKMAKPLYDKDYDEMVAYKNLSTKDKINKFIPKKEATKEELKKVSERLGRNYKPVDTKLQSVNMVYPEKYLIGPGGGAIGIARNAAGLGIKGLNKAMSYIPAPVSGALNAYFGAEGIKEFADPNSLTRKSMSRAYDDPTGSNIGDAAFDVGMNSLNFVGLPFNKAIKGSKNLIKGYKQVPKQLPGSPNAFKSEINWNNWNKEIPNNPELMKEYNAIEQQTKANGTWMKNPDGSVFKGTPEQFIQENSKNFKKSNLSSSKTYRVNIRGNDNNPIIHKPNSNIAFTGDEKSVRSYIFSGNKNLPLLSATDSPSTLGLHELYATGNKRLTIDAKNASFDNVVYNGKNDKTYTIAKESFLNPEINNVNILNVKNDLEGPMSLFEKIIGRKYGNELINKQVSGNYLKSARGNNGMFDMTNPNIYKSVLPIGLGLGATQYKQGGTTNDYIDINLTPEEIQKYKDGGYIVEEIDNYQDGGTVYTVKGSKGYYKKINGKWQVDWNRSGKYQPLSKGNIKARTAVLNKMAKPINDGMSKVSSNSSDNTRVNNIYQKPLDWSFDPKYKNNTQAFVKKSLEEKEKAIQKEKEDNKIKKGLANNEGIKETVGQYNRRKEKYDDLNLLGKMIENDPADNYKPQPVGRSPFEDFPMTGIGGAPKMILKAGKWLKPLLTGTKNATQPFRQATVSALKAPLPLGKTITNATAGTLTPKNLLFSYWAGESAYNQGDSNSDVRKSQSNLINNPSWNTLGDAAFETGVNSLGFSGLGLGKQVIKPVYNASKNVINNTYKVLGKNTKFFNSGEKPHWFKGYKQEWDPMLADLEPLSDFRTIQSGKNKGARTIWNDVEKKYRKMYYELETQKNAALKSNNKKLASDIDNKIQDIFYAKKKEFQEIHNKNFKSKKHPFKESLGSGRFSTVYGLPKSEFTVKVGTIPEGEDVFKLVKNAKNIKKSNIAVPKKTYTTSSGENVIVMNKVDPIEGSIFLNPPTKKSYEQLLKDTEELKNKGLYLDFQNHNNIVYNPSTGLFNIYDLNTTGYLFRNNRLGKTYDSSKKTIEQILIDTGKLPKDWKQLPTSNKTIAHLEASPNTMARLEKTNTNTTNYEENIFIPKSVVDNPTAKDLAENLELINKTKKFEVIDNSLKAKIINFIKSSLIPINENLIVPLRYRSSIKKAKEFFNEQKEYFKIPEVKAKLIKYGINPDDLQKIKFKYGNSGSSAAEKSIQFDPKQLKKLQKLGIQVDEKSAIAHEYGHILGFNGKDAFLPNITSGNLPINKEIFKKVINGKVKYGSPEHFLKYYAKDINTNTPESFAHLREMKQNMINNGIINRLDEPVTERQIIEFFSHDYGKGTDRVSSFVDIGDPKLIKFLSKELSKVRVLAPIIGAGALSSKTVQQKQKGGLVNNYVDAELTLKEIKDLIAQGYVIEELN